MGGIEPPSPALAGRFLFTVPSQVPEIGFYICVCCHFWLFATLWTIACQAPQSMGFFTGSSPPSDWTRVSCTGRQILDCSVTWDSSIEKSPKGTGSTQQTAAESNSSSSMELSSPYPKGQAAEAERFLKTGACWGRSCCFLSACHNHSYCCFGCKPKYRTLHTKPGWLLLQEEQNFRWFRASSLAGRRAAEDKEMDKEQIKQPSLRVTYLFWPLSPFSVLPNLDADFENKSQACFYSPAQQMPHSSYLQLISTPDNYPTFLKCWQLRARLVNHHRTFLLRIKL